MSYPNTATGFDQRNLLVDKEGVPFDSINPIPVVSSSAYSFSYSANDIEQRARVNITVNDWALSHATSGTNTIEVTDWQNTKEAQASIDITVVDYESITAGATITVDSNDLVEGVDWTAGTSNDDTATSLASAIAGLAGFGATATLNVITVTVDTAGTAGNAKEASSDDEFVTVGNGGDFSGGLNNATINVNGTTITQGTEWNSATNNSATATAIAVAITALAGYSATADGEVVTIVTDVTDATANDDTLVVSGDGLVAGSALFSGGITPATITIDGNTITESTEWDSEIDNETSATNLAVAISAITNYEAVAVDNIVTVFYETPGTSGNGKSISKTGGGLTLSGDTLINGGVGYSTVWDYSTSQVGSLEVSLNATQIDGTNASLSVQHQYSYDNVNWLDGYTFKTLTTEGVENATLNTVGKYSRFKITIGGVNPLIDLSLSGTIKPTQATSQVSESVLVTTSDIGAVNDTWKDQGSVIDMRGYTELGLEVTLDVNDSTGNKLQILSGMTSTPVAVLEEATDYQKTLGDADGVFFYKFVTDGLIPYLKIQTKATLVGATEGTVTIKITKKLC